MAINNQPTIKPRTVTGIFTRYIAKTLPLAFDESMSYYECLCALLEYINQTIVTDINNVNDGLSELQTFYLQLQDYVNNYFDNLDVQEEINNKLDDMVEAGTLDQIIEQYLNSSAVWGFDTVEDMKNATNLINGSYAKTLGYHAIDDGGSALYKITNIEDNSQIQEELDSGLFATLIINDRINVKQIGAYGDETHNDSNAFQKALDYIEANSYQYSPNNRANIGYDIPLYIPKGKYLLNERVTCESPYLKIIGDNAILITDESTDNILLFTNGYDISINNIQFVGGYNQIEVNDDSNRDHSKIEITNCRFWLSNNYSIKIFDQSCMAIINDSYFYQNNHIYESTMIDKTNFNNCWFSEGIRNANKDYSIKLLSGINTFTNCMFIPNGINEDSTLYTETCWIENHAMVTIQNSRVSNERGAKTLINNYAKLDFNPTTQALGQNTDFGTINLINNPFLATYTGSPFIRLYEMPRNIIIKNNTFTNENFKFIDFASEFNLQSFITNGFGTGELSTYSDYVINYIIKDNALKNHLPYTNVPLNLCEFISCDKNITFTFDNDKIKIPLIHKYLANNITSSFKYLVEATYRPDQNTNSCSNLIGILGFDVQEGGKITTKFNVISGFQGGNSTTEQTDITVTPLFDSNNTNQIAMASGTYANLSVSLSISPYYQGIQYSFKKL